jgi:hypothetical protein
LRDKNYLNEDNFLFLFFFLLFLVLFTTSLQKSYIINYTIILTITFKYYNLNFSFNCLLKLSFFFNLLLLFKINNNESGILKESSKQTNKQKAKRIISSFYLY